MHVYEVLRRPVITEKSYQWHQLRLNFLYKFRPIDSITHRTCSNGTNPADTIAFQIPGKVAHCLNCSLSGMGRYSRLLCEPTAEPCNMTTKQLRSY